MRINPDNVVLIAIAINLISAFWNLYRGTKAQKTAKKALEVIEHQARLIQEMIPSVGYVAFLSTHESNAPDHVRARAKQLLPEGCQVAVEVVKESSQVH